MKYREIYFQIQILYKYVNDEFSDTAKKLVAVKNEVQDLKTEVRDLNRKMDRIINGLIENKAITNNLPVKDLAALIPVTCDENLNTILENADLSNALFAKVSG